MHPTCNPVRGCIPMHPGCNATPCIQARAERDRQRMLELHEALRALQRQVETQASATGTATGATGAPPNVHAALPPLAGAATGAEVAGSRVHYLYFLSSFLLLKTALSKEGRMANAPAQEVFEEIVANATAQVETVVVVACWSWSRECHRLPPRPPGAARLRAWAALRTSDPQSAAPVSRWGCRQLAPRSLMMRLSTLRPPLELRGPHSPPHVAARLDACRDSP